MAYILEHVIAVTLLAALFELTGRVVERCSSGVRLVTERLPVFRIALGMAVWIGIAFVLASIGHLTGRTLTTLAIATVVVGGFTLRDSFASALRREQRNRAPSSRNLAERWSLLLFLPVVVITSLFIRQLDPSIAFDDAVYHLALPKLYIAAGGFREVPFNLYSQWPHNTELLYALAMIWQDYILAKLVNWLTLALLVLAVVSFAAAARGRLAASVAACMLLANFTLLWEAKTAYIDIALALWAFMAFWLTSEFLDRRRMPFLFLAGLFAGIAAGSKLSGLFVAFCLVAVVLAELPTLSDSWRSAVRSAAVLLGVTAIVVAPWYLRSVLHTGSPAFPFGYGFLPSRLPEYEWSFRLSQQFQAFHTSIGMGRTWSDYLLLPYRVIVEARPGRFDTFDGRLNPLWLLLVPMSVVGSLFDRFTRRLMIFTGVYFVLWAVTSQQIRFLIPILPHASCAAGAVVAMTVDRLALAFRNRRSDRIGVVMTRLAPLHAVVVSAVFQVSLLWVARFDILEAQRQGTRLFAGWAPTLNETRPPVYDFLNHDVPIESRLMILNDSNGFFLDREFVADSMPQASQMADLLSRDPTVEGIGRTLQSLQITHVVVHGRQWGIEYPPALWTFLKSEQRARVVYTSQDRMFVVFELIRGVEHDRPAA